LKDKDNVYIVDLESNKIKYILYNVNLLVKLGKASSVNWYPCGNKPEEKIDHLSGEP
jgi:hypothetical protein